MKKEYWIILIVYIAMQLSSFVGIPLVTHILEASGNSTLESQRLAIPYWLLISFTAAFLITLFLLRKERMSPEFARGRTSVGSSVAWAIGGVFLALFAQSIAASIERLLGINMGSENTQAILKLIQAFPLVLVISSIIGPILEEIVFRKIIFGSLYKRFNFFISALISSVVFALAHMEPVHILLYASMGFTFAFLYVRTKNIFVSMFAHVAMNTFVVLVQSVYKDQIERMMQDADKIQSFIGGFL